jgi:hypothetical protein
MPDAQVAKSVFVYRFDYLLKGNEWTAYIAGYSQDECRIYLNSLVGDVHIVQISQESRLDALTNELRNKILDASKKKPGRPPKTPGEETVAPKK